MIHEACPIVIASPDLSGRGNLSVAIPRDAGYFLPGVWGCPPAILIPPLLKERGTGGEVNKSWDRLKCLLTWPPFHSFKYPPKIGGYRGLIKTTPASSL